MLTIKDEKPVDFKSLIEPFLCWLKSAAWFESDGEGKIAAAKAIVNIWDWAEALISEDCPESERYLSESANNEGNNDNSEDNGEHELPSDFEIFKKGMKKVGLKPAERELMKKRVQATERLRERRDHLARVLLAHSEVPIEYHGTGKAFLSMIVLMGAKNQKAGAKRFRRLRGGSFPRHEAGRCQAAIQRHLPSKRC